MWQQKHANLVLTTVKVLTLFFYNWNEMGYWSCLNSKLIKRNVIILLFDAIVMHLHFFDWSDLWFHVASNTCKLDYFSWHDLPTSNFSNILHGVISSRRFELHLNIRHLNNDLYFHRKCQSWDTNYAQGTWKMEDFGGYILRLSALMYPRTWLLYLGISTSICKLRYWHLV